MNKTESFVEYLKSKFEPVSSIILHGSRAKDRSRIHSDWDFIVLVDYDPKISGGREIVEGENVEYIVKPLPIKKDKIIDIFGSNLRGARVLYDLKEEGKKLLEIAEEIYKEGLALSKEEIRSRELALLSSLDGMVDYIDEPSIFLKHHSVFYARVINYWFHVKKQQYSKNLYDALPEIEREDIDFYKELKIIWDYASSAEEKVRAGKRAVELLFHK